MTNAELQYAVIESRALTLFTSRKSFKSFMRDVELYGMLVKDQTVKEVDCIAIAQEAGIAP